MTILTIMIRILVAVHAFPSTRATEASVNHPATLMNVTTASVVSTQMQEAKGIPQRLLDFASEMDMRMIVSYRD